MRIRKLRGLFEGVPDDALYPSKLGVRRDRRHGGLGGKLLDDLLDQDAARTVYLDVSAANEDALKLYASRGFRVVSVQRRLDLEYACMVFEP